MEALVSSRTDGADVHRAQIALAKLVADAAPPTAMNALAVAEAFIEGRASTEELLGARADIWAHVGSLACYCSITDSASSQVVLACLEPKAADHTVSALRETLVRVLQCGVAPDAVMVALTSHSDENGRGPV